MDADNQYWQINWFLDIVVPISTVPRKEAGLGKSLGTMGSSGFFLKTKGSFAWERETHKTW